METTLRFEFDNQSFFPKNFKGSKSIIIKNPPVIPSTGDKVDFRMSDFFSDETLLDNFEDYTDGILLFADRITSLFSKDEVEVIVVLYEEDVFKTLYPQYMRETHF